MSFTTTIDRLPIPAPEPGVYRDMPAEHYHKIDALNASTIGEFVKSGLHGRHAMQTTRPATGPLYFGSAFHSATLEPDDFFSRAEVFEEIGPSAEVKHRKTQDEHPDAIILRKGWLEQIGDMRDQVIEHDTADYLFNKTKGENELTMIWNIERTIGGVPVTIPCKARADRYLKAFEPYQGSGEVSAIIDLKTCRDASPEGFEKAIADRGYYRQAAWYLAGAVACGLIPDFHDYSYIIVAVEKAKPYPVATYPIATAALQYGLNECEAALRNYVKYRMHGVADGPSNVLIPLGLPNWAMKAGNEHPFNQEVI